MRKGSKARLKYYFIGALFFVVAFVLFSSEKREEHNQINLRWNKAYANENWWNVRTGLLWSFSQIGAHLPAGSFDQSITFSKDSSWFCIDFTKLGFSSNALKTIASFNAELKKSEEYKKFNAIELGRWLVYVIYSGNHYYQLVDAPATLSEFKRIHPQNTQIFLLNKSSVSLGVRKIEFHEDDEMQSQFYIASEGKYDSVSNSFESREFETIDIMANSQPRYAIYGSDGNLKISGDALLSKAGKIAKCMWCHESKIEKLFTNNVDYTDYLTRSQFESKIERMNAILFDNRKKQKTDLNWFNKFDHTQSELLYIAFMQASAYKIAKEWGTDLSEVEQKLAQIKPEIYDEFPFLGNLYQRSLIDSLAPYKATAMPYFVRESSAYEPK
jgi:hypothetical protein